MYSLVTIRGKRDDIIYRKRRTGETRQNTNMFGLSHAAPFTLFQTSRKSQITWGHIIETFGSKQNHKSRKQPKINTIKVKEMGGTSKKKSHKRIRDPVATRINQSSSPRGGVRKRQNKTRETNDSHVCASQCITLTLKCLHVSPKDRMGMHFDSVSSCQLLGYIIRSEWDWWWRYQFGKQQGTASQHPVTARMASSPSSSSTDDTSFSLLHSCEVDAFQGWNEPNASSSNEKRVILLFARSNISDGCVLIQISDTSLSHHREEDLKLLFPSRKRRLATR